MRLKYVHTPFLVKSLFSSQSAESTRLQFTPNRQSLSRLRQWAILYVSRHSCVSSCSACHVRMHFWNVCMLYPCEYILYIAAAYMYVCTYLYTYIHRCTALLCSVRFCRFHNASYFKQTVVLGNCCHLSSITYVCVCVQRYAYTRYVGPEARAGQAPTCLLVVSSGGVSSHYNPGSIPWSGSTPCYCSWMQVLSAFLQLTDSYVHTCAYARVCTHRVRFGSGMYCAICVCCTIWLQIVQHFRRHPHICACHTLGHTLYKLWCCRDWVLSFAHIPCIVTHIAAPTPTRTDPHTGISLSTISNQCCPME